MALTNCCFYRGFTSNELWENLISYNGADFCKHYVQKVRKKRYWDTRCMRSAEGAGWLWSEVPDRGRSWFTSTSETPEHMPHIKYGLVMYFDGPRPSYGINVGCPIEDYFDVTLEVALHLVCEEIIEAIPDPFSENRQFAMILAPTFSAGRVSTYDPSQAPQRC